MTAPKPGQNPDPTKPNHNPQHEAFILACALKDMQQQQAYVEAGFEANKSAASALRNAPEIAARIDWLKMDRAERMIAASAASMTALGYTKDDAMAEAQTILMRAMAIDDLKAAVAAVTLKSKLAGVLVEGGPRKVRGLGDLTIAEIENLLDELGARDAGVSVGGVRQPAIEGSFKAEA